MSDCCCCCYCCSCCGKSAKVAVVTGGNRGLGYCLVKHLAEQFKGVVVLTAVNKTLGKGAIAKLRTDIGYPDSFRVRFHQLDITDIESIKIFKEYLKEEFAGIDVLINNAAVCYDMHPQSKASLAKVTETVETNYFGTKQVCDNLFPILRKKARIINICCETASLKLIRNPEHVETLKGCCKDITTEAIQTIMETFLTFMKNGGGTHEFPISSYMMSKIGLVALTQQQQPTLQYKKATVIAISPGVFVKTELGKRVMGQLDFSEASYARTFLSVSPDEAAAAIVQFALYSDEGNNLGGKFLDRNGKILDWERLPTLSEILKDKNGHLKK